MVLRLFFLAAAIIAGWITVIFPANTALAGRLYVNTNPLFEACLQRCGEQTPLGGLTRRGCYKGCAEIRRSFSISNSYRSMASCIEDMNDLELERDLVIEKHQAWCDKKWPHLHKRKGCKDAMEVYIRAATVNTICYHQLPEAIARQTPHTTMTMPNSSMSLPPSSAPAGVSAAPSSGSMPYGNVLAMPPVYDTPKYRQSSPKTMPKSVTPRAKTSASPKGPTLAPPKQAAKPIAQSAAKSATGSTAQTTPKTAAPVPVITPSTATANRKTPAQTPVAAKQDMPAATQGTAKTTATPENTGTEHTVTTVFSVPPTSPAPISSAPASSAPASSASALLPGQPNQHGQLNQQSPPGPMAQTEQTGQQNQLDQQRLPLSPPPQQTIPPVPERAPVLNAATAPLARQSSRPPYLCYPTLPPRHHPLR